MKLGHKIAMFYTTVTVCIITLVIIIFYFFTSHYIDKIFDSLLVEKVNLTAQKHWEKDEVDPRTYKIIEQKYDELLPNAEEILLNVDSLSFSKGKLYTYLTRKQVASLLAGSLIHFKNDNQLGVALYYPDNQGDFIAIVLSQNTYGERIHQHMLVLMILLLLFSSVLIYITGRVYSSRIIAPLHQILDELKRIRGNNLKMRLKTSSNKDELDQLTCTLNEMLDRLDSAFQSEKSFISNASHELNNPITAIQGECEITLLKERSVAEYQKALERIFAESKRISQLTRNLLFLSHQDEEFLKNSIESVSLDDILRQLADDVSRVNFISEKRPNNLFILKANPYLLKIAFQNIITNACKYSKDKVDVRLFMADEKIVVEVEDYGIGIPENEINKIFQSFYRATNTRAYSGNGIGLSLSFKIFSIYGGKIDIVSELNKYTKFSVTFSCNQLFHESF